MSEQTCPSCHTLYRRLTDEYPPYTHCPRCLAEMKEPPEIMKVTLNLIESGKITIDEAISTIELIARLKDKYGDELPPEVDFANDIPPLQDR